MLRNQDEDELQQILSETFITTNYVDQQIQPFIQSPHHEEVQTRNYESNQSHSSRKSSESSQLSFFRDQHSYGSSNDRHSGSQHRYSHEKVIEKGLIQDQTVHIFDDFYKTINDNLKAETIEEIRYKYPLYLLSQPQYQIKDHIKDLSFGYSGNLIRKNILVMDAGYCQQQKVFKVAIGTDEGQVIIFQPNSSKPQQIIDCFSKVSYITTLKWSKNLQFLSISNDLKELKVYSFKQAITIQTSVNYRLIKTPVEHCELNDKQLKKIIIQAEFIDELPFKMILVTENEDLLILEMKKHLFSWKPQLTPISYKVKDFLDIRILPTLDQNKNKGCFLAVSGWEFVTICLIEPHFEVAMVYDKEKHGGNIKKYGYPHISFRENPTSLLIIWDQYLQIVDINIQSLSPPAYRFSIKHRFLLPETSILGGFLSNTLIYQVTKLGINIYSTTSFDSELSRKHDPKQIYFHKLQYMNFCYGQRIEEAVKNSQVELSDLRYLKGLFSTSNRTLFYSTNKGIQLISINNLQTYVTTLIENSNWKTALEILKNSYEGVVYQLDQLKQESIVDRIKEISMRYINFLETVIRNDISNEANMLLLWDQQLIFIFNIVITVHQQEFLLSELLQKVYKLNPQYLKNIIPFILNNKVLQLTLPALELFLQTIPKDIISKLIYNLQTNHNENDLPHHLNSLLIKHSMYLEMIDLNQKFQDHFTPTAILVGVYLKLEQDNEKNIMELTEQKKYIGKLIAYSVYDTFSSINFNKYSKHQNKEILNTLIPLLTAQIISILIKQNSTALFELILEELYMGNCLQTLNQLQLTDSQNDLMVSIALSINVEEVTKYQCLKIYWTFILKLYQRRIIHVKIYNGLYYLCLEDQIDKEIIQRFTSKCYEHIINEFTTISEDILNSFFEALLGTEHICLVKLVGKMLKRFIDVLEAMLPKKSENNKLYDFMDQCLPALSDLQLKVLQTLLKDNIQLLTEIDPSRASDIICKYFLSDLHLFIDDLEGFKFQQLELIHAVLQLYSYKESLLDLKVKYLQLLALTGNPDIILEELMKENYPLDESLEICKKYDVLEAYAYLLVKSGATGHIEAAIRVYFNLVWQKVYKIILNALNPQPQLYQVIMHYLHKCIHICIQLQLQEHQIEWFNIMQELELLKKKTFKDLHIDAHICEMVKNIVNQDAYPELIKMMLTDIEYENVIVFLGMRIGGFDLQAIQIVISEMKKSYLYEKQIHLILQDILIDHQNSLRKCLLADELKGFRTSDVCDYCHRKGGLLVHYKCGHEVHPPCSQDVRQCIICLEDTEVIYAKKIDSMLKIKVDIYSGGISEEIEEVQHQIQKENVWKKMENYDELALLTSFNFDWQ